MTIISKLRPFLQPLAYCFSKHANYKINSRWISSSQMLEFKSRKPVNKETQILKENKDATTLRLIDKYSLLLKRFSYSLLVLVFAGGALYYFLTERFPTVLAGDIDEVSMSIDVTFDDVKGCDEAKDQLQDLVHFLKYPRKYEEMNVKLPKGVVLYGPPGVGKTLLAKAIAGEAGVPFYSINGGSVEKMFVGSGAKTIKNMFKTARQHRPCILFIDEVDSICQTRFDNPMYPYANQTSNQFLTEMDGLHDSDGIIVIGATNKFDGLDKAAVRPGRFSRHIEIGLPDFRGRVELLELYLSKVVADPKIDTTKLAWATRGYTGADIANLINQAALISGNRNGDRVEMSDINEADMKMVLGAKRKQISQETRLIAYHEAGHAIATYFSPDRPFDIKHVTILPRGRSGGHNSFVQTNESKHYTKAQLKSQLDGILGGRAAELLMGGNNGLSTGVSSDMENATRIARSMVQVFTMSENDDIGLRVAERIKCPDCHANLVSQKMCSHIDNAVNKLLKDSLERSIASLKKHEKEWKRLTEYLLKYETLSGDEVEQVIKGEGIEADK